jgi:hypothetical protein
VKYAEFEKYEILIYNPGCSGKRFPVVWLQTVDMLGRFTPQKNQVLLASQCGISNSEENYFHAIGFIEIINKGR